MSLYRELRSRNQALWEQVVTHPFVEEMGADTLPLEKFQRYFLQDYLFLRDFTRLLALGVAKAPDFSTSRRLARFLAGILDGEEGLFRRSFREWGLTETQYTSTAIGSTSANIITPPINASASHFQLPRRTILGTRDAPAPIR